MGALPVLMGGSMFEVHGESERLAHSVLVSGASASTHELAHYVRQDAAVLKGDEFLRCIDAHGRVERS